jgi:hypothetical protein
MLTCYVEQLCSFNMASYQMDYYQQYFVSYKRQKYKFNKNSK